MERPHLLIDAAFGRPTHRRPVWLMRQAGRYLPEYQAIRAKHDFLTMCRTPDLAVEISLQPYRRFHVDAAIIFSDILFVPEAMGLNLSFEPEPKFSNPLRSAAEINALKPFDPGVHTQWLFKSIAELKRELHDDVPVLGFSGAPWTLAVYMIEGRHSKTLQYAKGLRYTDPGLLHRLLSKLTDALGVYLRAQIDAGADAVQVFDTFALELSPADYEEFALPYLQRLFQNLRAPDVPLMLFSKGCGGLLELMAQSGADVLSLDWTVDLADARQRVGDRVALQGNLDPLALLATPEFIIEAVRRQLAAYGHFPGYIGNLGHGVLPFIPPDAVALYVRKFQELSRGYGLTP